MRSLKRLSQHIASLKARNAFTDSGYSVNSCNTIVSILSGVVMIFVPITAMAAAIGSTISASVPAVAESNS